MWKLLVPLLILLVVALIGVRTYENYINYSGNIYDASGNIIGNLGKNSIDTTGNIIDASGNVIGNINDTGANTSDASKSGLITLSLTDLLTLFGKSSTSASTSTAAESTDTSTSSTTTSSTTTNNAIDMYNQIKPSLISDISSAVRYGLSGAPYTPASPVIGGGVCSDSSAQGAEFQSAQANMVDSNEYIRKDSIPCYGCTLPQ